MSGAEIVKHGDAIAAPNQHIDDMAADIARPASDEKG
jgi:hypothetical protein